MYNNELPPTVLLPSGKIVQTQSMTAEEAGEMVDGIDRTLREVTIHKNNLEREISDLEIARTKYRDMWIRLSREQNENVR